MVSWRNLTLGEAGIELLDCVHKTPVPALSGRPYLAIPQMKEGRIDLSDARLISESDCREWTRKALPQTWDVVLSRRCNPGVTAHVPEGTTFALGQNLVLLRADGTAVFPPFLRWLTRSPSWWNEIQRFLNVGAVFESLRCADVPNFRLPIPDLDTQKAIAGILGTLDDKIELNRRMNETLEGIARAIFKSWFIDFDPVRAKAEGRETGLPKEIENLFPDGLEDSELGEIPKGWTVGTLADLSELNPETWKPATAPEHITYVDLANTKNGVINSTQDYSFRDAPSRARRVLRCGDTIVGTVRPGNRSFAYVSRYGLTGSTGFAVLRPKSSAAREFVYLVATREDSIDHLAHLADGAAYPAVRPDVVHSLECMVPTSEALTAFHAAVAPLFAGMGSNMEISQSLDAARDHLLPSLLSGRVPIPLTQEAAP